MLRNFISKSEREDAYHLVISFRQRENLHATLLPGVLFFGNIQKQGSGRGELQNSRKYVTTLWSVQMEGTNIEQEHLILTNNFTACPSPIPLHAC